jgi:hypothetical protein
MSIQIETLGSAAIALTLAAPAAMATTASSPAANVVYTTSFTSDKTPVTATADFSVNAKGQLVLTLTNTTLSAYEDSQNLAAISFELSSFGSSTYLTHSTLDSISGDSISSTPLNKDVSGLITGSGATLATTPWTTNAGNTVASFTPTGSIAWFSQIGSGKNMDAPGSIAPFAGADNKYSLPASNCTTGTGKSGGCGYSLEYGSNKVDDPMIYGTATFVFDVKGLGYTLADISHCSSGMTCISNVQFGFGPDGLDADDIGAGKFTKAIPEPSTVLFQGLGVAGLWVAQRRRRVRQLQ